MSNKYEIIRFVFLQCFDRAYLLDNGNKVGSAGRGAVLGERQYDLNGKLPHSHVPVRVHVTQVRQHHAVDQVVLDVQHSHSHILSGIYMHQQQACNAFKKSNTKLL